MIMQLFKKLNRYIQRFKMIFMPVHHNGSGFLDVSKGKF